MHTDETIVAQRWVIVVLTLLILLVGFLWLNARADAQNREEVTRIDINNLRTEVNSQCDTTGTTTAARRQACEDILRDVAGVLVQYANEFRSAIGTTTSNIIQGGQSNTSTGTSTNTTGTGTGASGTVY